MDLFGKVYGCLQIIISKFSYCKFGTSQFVHFRTANELRVLFMEVSFPVILSFILCLYSHTFHSFSFMTENLDYLTHDTKSPTLLNNPIRLTVVLAQKSCWKTNITDINCVVRLAIWLYKPSVSIFYNYFCFIIAALLIGDLIV